MIIVKKSLRIVLRILLGILVFLVSYVLLVLLLSRIPVNTGNERQKAEIPIYILSNGVHTDIVLPVKNEITDWTKEIRFETTKAKESRADYIAFGWGDKGFYLHTPEWSDLTAGTAFKAVSGLGSSAMHITFYKKLKESENCKKIMISKAEYQQLVDFVNSSFARDVTGKIQWISGYSYGENDAFYEAKGAYNLFYTCNTWANNALKSAHQKACLWTVYDKGIFYHYEKK